jgi:AcrR family transcriptional regulator
MGESARRYHHGDLRAALLSRAEAELSRGSVGSLSLRGLARDLGVSHGAPREHFRTKQALLDALAETGFERLGRQLDDAMTDDQGTFTQRLTVFAQAYVRFATRHPSLIELMFASLHRPDADRSLRGANDRAFAAPVSLIASALDGGEIVVDPDRAAMTIIATLQGLAWLANSTVIGERPVEAVVADTVETMARGLQR